MLLYDAGVDPPTTRAELLAGGHVRRIELTGATPNAATCPVSIIVLTDIGVVSDKLADPAWRGQRVHIRAVNAGGHATPSDEHMALVERVSSVPAGGDVAHTMMRFGDIATDIASMSTKYNHILKGVSVFCNSLHKSKVEKRHIEICINPADFDACITRKQIAFLDNPTNRFHKVAYFMRIDMRCHEPHVGVLVAARDAIQTLRVADFCRVEDPAVLNAMRVIDADPAVCLEEVSWPCAPPVAPSVDADIMCAICMDSTGGVLVCVRPCGHSLHAECLQKWFCTFAAWLPGKSHKNSITCPMCRAVVCGVGSCHAGRSGEECEFEGRKRRRVEAGSALEVDSTELARVEGACATSHRMFVKIQHLNQLKDIQYRKLVQGTRFFQTGAVEATCFKSCLCECHDCVSGTRQGFATADTPVAAMRWLSKRVNAMHLYADSHDTLDIERGGLTRVIGPWKLRGSGEDGTPPKMLLLMSVRCWQLARAYKPCHVECVLKCLISPGDRLIYTADMLVSPTMAEAVEWRQNMNILTTLMTQTNATVV